MTPEIRTKPATAIMIVIGALLSMAIAVFGSGQLEKLLDSQVAATVILGLWVILGSAAAIAAIVDAWVEPEGERLSLATTIAATVFAVLALAVIAGVVAGAANLHEDDPARASAEER